MSKHTPGRWIADLYEDGCFVVRVHGSETPEICERGIWIGSESHANARLIAAAPEMLEALKAIVEEIPAEYEWIDVKLSNARAVIAKAEGVTK